MSNQKITLSIPDMHCPSCPKLIKITLSEMKGILNVETSLETRTASIEFDSSKTSIQLLIQALREIGYNANLI